MTNEIYTIPNIENLFKYIADTYLNDEYLIFNEPKTKEKASWGGPLCCFTGDTALFYLSIKLLDQSGFNVKKYDWVQNFLKQFEVFIQVIILNITKFGNRVE